MKVDMQALSSVSLIFLLLIAFIGVVFIRYLLVAGIFHLVYHGRISRIKPNERIIAGSYKKHQLAKEIYFSAVTSVIFGATAIVMLLLWKYGLVRLYLDWGLLGWWYEPLSLLLYLLIHETYYYWLHRWMHRPSVFALLHRVHHQSIVPSPWTSFSFHPLEAILQALVIPVTMFFLPIHPVVLLLLLVIMTVTSVINHLNVEIYPARWKTSPVMRWLIGATHHAMHHHHFHTNFGLYFTFWDTWMGTDSEQPRRLRWKKKIRTPRYIPRQNESRWGRS